MDTDQIKGKLQNAFGKAEEAVGNAIGNQNLANAGAEDQLKGAATETWGNAKDAVDSISNTSHTRTAVEGVHASATDESFRDKIVDGAERLKDSISAKMDDVKNNDADKRNDLNRTI